MAKNVIIDTLNIHDALHDANHREEQLRRLEEALKRNDISNVEDLVFTGVKGSRTRLQQIVKYGIRFIEEKKRPKKKTSAQSLEEMHTLSAEQSGWCTSIGYVDRLKNPALVVYNRQELQHVEKDPHGGDVFQAKENSSFREALIAILLITKKKER